MTASKTTNALSPAAKECCSSPPTLAAGNSVLSSTPARSLAARGDAQPGQRLPGRLIQRYRSMHGNTTVSKDDFVRGLLAAMKAGETVGILMDTNMTPPQGVFVDFFGIAACTASGLARIALRTDAAVVPAFTIWDPTLRKYRLRFDPRSNWCAPATMRKTCFQHTVFTKVIEDYVRRYPDQWLWVHRRWKTRPPGEPGLY